MSFGTLLRPKPTPLGRALSWVLVAIIVVTTYADARYDLHPRGSQILLLGVALLLLTLWTFPSLDRHLGRDEEDEQDAEQISPRRRLVVAVLFVLTMAIMGGSTYLEEVDGFGRRWSALAFSVAIILLGLLTLIVPRNENAQIDMRPAWLVIAVVFAIFFYLMFSV